jgi:hypothetical protein
MELTAGEFVRRLEALATEETRRKYDRYFPVQHADDYFIGTGMGKVFELAKEFIDLPIVEIETLLESPIHEVRAGGVSIMDKCARRKKTGEARRKEMYDLYLRRTDRINNWDLVDLGVPYVVGAYLTDKPRYVLYALAKSENPWERRIAIVTPLYFLMKTDETEDAEGIAEMLVNDPHPYVQKGIGWALRVLGGVDEDKLHGFLDRHASTMDRGALRTALEKSTKEVKDRYMRAKP